ncbi:hypothetical protein J2X76_001401 [Neorhizobium sp. 2083]|uniref:hypothetical protein n=1 Tax=Neorhizobium sp. 2083 TaxID=2817762 RepID=UPI002863A47C|nr:hypothetical protein [Neorhizobium sp. 2083]MDR6816247.1 hypothetical protein [Neorhizobium sp. 2083]
MTFTGGSWHFGYSVSREELAAGTELLAQYRESRQRRPRRLARALLTSSLLFVPFLVFVAMTYLDDFLRWLSDEWRASLTDGVMPSLAAIAGLVLLILLMTKPREAALPVSTIRHEERDVYHVRATADTTTLSAHADGMAVELDVRGLQEIVELDGWLLLLHADGPVLLPRRIFPDDETANSFITFVRDLIRRPWRLHRGAMRPGGRTKDAADP